MVALGNLDRNSIWHFFCPHTLASMAGQLVCGALVLLSFAVCAFWLDSVGAWPEAFDGFRIVHISDLHVNSFETPADLQRVLSRVNEARIIH